MVGDRIGTEAVASAPRDCRGVGEQIHEVPDPWCDQVVDHSPEELGREVGIQQDVEDERLDAADVGGEREGGTERNRWCDTYALGCHVHQPDNVGAPARGGEVGGDQRVDVGRFGDERVAAIDVGHVVVIEHDDLADCLGFDVVDVEVDGGHVDAEVGAGVELGLNQQFWIAVEVALLEAESSGRKLVMLGEHGHSLGHLAFGEGLSEHLVASLEHAVVATRRAQLCHRALLQSAAKPSALIGAATVAALVTKRTRSPR